MDSACFGLLSCEDNLGAWLAMTDTISSPNKHVPANLIENLYIICGLKPGLATVLL